MARLKHPQKQGQADGTSQPGAPITVTQWPVADLVPSEYNPRQMTVDEVEALSASLKRFGLVDPLIVNTHPDRYGVIVGGHQRFRIATERLGMETVPVVEVCLTRDREMELNIRLNRNTGGWDWDALANYFEPGDLVEWGFTEGELDLGAIPEWDGGDDQEDTRGGMNTPGRGMSVISIGRVGGLVEHDLVTTLGEKIMTLPGSDDAERVATFARRAILSRDIWEPTTDDSDDMEDDE